MIKKEKKTKVERLCHDLNHIRRMGCQASPIEMFFNRPVKGLLPNQFAKENEIRQSLEKRITNQFKLALKKGRFSRDSFQEGDIVRIRSPRGVWDTHRTVISRRSTNTGEGSQYEVKTDEGKKLTRHGTFLHHSQFPDKTEKEKTERKRNRNQGN